MHQTCAKERSDGRVCREDEERRDKETATNDEKEISVRKEESSNYSRSTTRSTLVFNMHIELLKTYAGTNSSNLRERAKR